MNDFDTFSDNLLEQAKRFLEIAKEKAEEEAIDAYLNAALLLSVSSLEAFVNGISDDFSSSDQFSVIEKSFLLEKEIELKNGVFHLTQRLKMSRLTERIEILSYKFDENSNIKKEKWWDGLLEGIKIRNNIVHPKTNTLLKNEQVDKTITSIIECINYLFLKIYGKGLPSYSLGLQSKFSF